MNPNIQKILDFTNSPEIQLEYKELMQQMSLTESDKTKARSYFEDTLVNIYKMALEYKLNINEIEDPEVADHFEQEFNNQLCFFWLELQSEWVRLNNLINFKLNVKQEEDLLMQAESSICSLFLNPLANYIDTETVEASLASLEQLLERAKFSNPE